MLRPGSFALRSAISCAMRVSARRTSASRRMIATAAPSAPAAWSPCELASSIDSFLASRDRVKGARRMYQGAVIVSAAEGTSAAGSSGPRGSDPLPA